MAAEVIQKLKCHFFFIQRVASDCTAGRKVIAAFFDDNFGHNIPGYRKARNRLQGKALFGFGNTGFITGFGRFLPIMPLIKVDLPTLDTANQTRSGFRYLWRCGIMGGRFGNFAMRASFGRIKRNGAGILAAVVVFEPNLVRRDGKVLFVQDFEFWLAFGQLGA